jgi:DUF1365 family protein
VLHQFRYAATSFYLDLDELPALDRLRLLGVNRRALFGFRDTDHMDGRAGSTREKIFAFLRANGTDLPGGKVHLLTQCRLFGYVFNPASFYFAHDASGALRAVVAEVNNTFGERLLYMLDDRNRQADPEHPELRRYHAKKRLHVSPFVSMDAAYDFRFAPVGERLSVFIGEAEHGAHFFEAHLWGKRRPLDDRALLRLALRAPLLTLKVTAAIHWQALHLYRKGVPIHHQPAPSPEQVAQLQLLQNLGQGTPS